MALSNLQYDEIQRQYDARQLHNQHILQKRKQQLYLQYPRLKELETLIASASVHFAKLLLDGDEQALAQLKQVLAHYRIERSNLLTQAGLSEQYLEPPYTCPDCKDTGYIDGKRCHCFEQAAIDLVYTQSNIKSILKEENFTNYSFAY